MNALSTYPMSELKLVYRVLHAALRQNLDLMDAEQLSDLQTLLRERATAEGVDTTDHGAWDAWLGKTQGPSPVRSRLTLVDGGIS